MIYSIITIIIVIFRQFPDNNLQNENIHNNIMNNQNFTYVNYPNNKLIIIKIMAIIILIVIIKPQEFIVKMYLQCKSLRMTQIRKKGQFLKEKVIGIV